MATRGCVVIIDDSADFRESLRDLLLEEGYWVHMARDGQDGYSLVSSLRLPCLMLLDLVMPSVNGFEFLALLQASPELLSLPVLVLTALYPVPRLDGIAGLLLKPADVDTILAEVAKHCPSPFDGPSH